MPPEQDPFLKLITDNRLIIAKICYAYCQTAADREDLAQEIMLTLWKGRERYHPEFKFSTWLYRVALNVAISYYRKRKTGNMNVSLADAAFIQTESAPDAAEELEKIQLLNKEIAALKELDKAIILLYLDEKSYKEMAEIIGITETNVATRLGRIKERIKQNISNKMKL